MKRQKVVQISIILLTAIYALSCSSEQEVTPVKSGNIKGETTERVPTGSLTTLSSGPWIQLPGKANDIGVGANGSVWIIGYGSGNREVYYWNGSNWTKIDGAGIHIDVDPQGNPWITNTSGELYQRIGGAGGYWQKIATPQSANDVGIAADGGVYITTRVGGTADKVYKKTSTGWLAYFGTVASRVTATNGGSPIIVDPIGRIFRHTGIGWEQVEGSGRDLGGNSTTSGGYMLYLVGSGNTQNVFYYDGSNPSTWLLEPGDGWGTNIDVDPQGNPWITNGSGSIFRK
jgi:hypothetical protein